ERPNCPGPGRCSRHSRPPKGHGSMNLLLASSSDSPFDSPPVSPPPDLLIILIESRLVMNVSPSSIARLILEDAPAPYFFPNSLPFSLLCKSMMRRRLSLVGLRS